MEGGRPSTGDRAGQHTGRRALAGESGPRSPLPGPPALACGSPPALPASALAPSAHSRSQSIFPESNSCVSPPPQSPLSGAHTPAPARAFALLSPPRMFFPTCLRGQPSPSCLSAPSSPQCQPPARRSPPPPASIHSLSCLLSFPYFRRSLSASPAGMPGLEGRGLEPGSTSDGAWAQGRGPAREGWEGGPQAGGRKAAGQGLPGQLQGGWGLR